MAKELKQLRQMISSVPGVVQTVPELCSANHRISRFAAPIADTEIPKRFQTPNMKLYDGTTDPEEHIAQYRERILKWDLGKILFSRHGYYMASGQDGPSSSPPRLDRPGVRDTNYALQLSPERYPEELSVIIAYLLECPLHYITEILPPENNLDLKYSRSQLPSLWQFLTSVITRAFCWNRNRTKFWVPTIGIRAKLTALFVR
ncbi:hypothetical protein LXL04_037204 [Taraxacum kok-saghyz]